MASVAAAPPAEKPDARDMRLVIAASSSDEPLSQDEIDHVLGVDETSD